MNDWIQVILTLTSSIIIVIVTVIVNKQTHYDKEWWQKKVLKYEEVFEILSDLEEHYKVQIEMLDNPNMAPGENINAKPISLSIKELDTIVNLSEFYFSEKTVNVLKEVKREVYNVVWSWAPEDEHKLYEAAYQEIVTCKKVIIEQRKSELRLKK